MEQETNPRVSLDEIHARMGMTITAEGMARARKRLRDAAARRDHEGRAAFLAQLRTGTA